ncbi:hypothetical protein L7F22_063566 [Adiantum nelumboides]|nr:hypothetical protein [Adiantum nelumboides]
MGWSPFAARPHGLLLKWAEASWDAAHGVRASWVVAHGLPPASATLRAWSSALTAGAAPRAGLPTGLACWRRPSGPGHLWAPPHWLGHLWA